MKSDHRNSRREFVRLCGAALLSASANPAALAGQDQTLRRYQRTCLVDERDRPLRANQLGIGVSYVFAYPYATTPCFLIDLGRPAAGPAELRTKDGDGYVWRGGVGPNRSIVAFSAICAHKMTHPARQVSFINYRHDEVRFRNDRDEVDRRAGVIYCCSENSVYDPAAGARVLGGPAPQPLATILMDFEPDTGCLFAAGTIGGEMFESFFDKFRFRLELEHGLDDVRTLVADTTTTVLLENYSKTRRLCG